MKINWKIRLKNKSWVIAFISALFLLAQQVLTMFGISFDYSAILEKVVGAIGTIFVLLAMLGITVDPTTEGFDDSLKALTYTEPSKDTTKYEEFEEGEH